MYGSVRAIASASCRVGAANTMKPVPTRTPSSSRAAGAVLPTRCRRFGWCSQETLRNEESRCAMVADGASGLMRYSDVVLNARGAPDFSHEHLRSLCQRYHGCEGLSYMLGLQSITKPPYQADPVVSEAKQHPQQNTSAQQSPQVRAQIAAIYAEAQADHWSQAQLNLAITKAVEQSGSSTSGTMTSTMGGDRTRLIDVNV